MIFHWKAGVVVKHIVSETVSKCQDVNVRSLWCVVAQSCQTLYDPLDWQPLGLQPTRLLCPLGFSREEYWSGLTCPLPGIFLTRDGTQISCMHRDSLSCLSCQLLINGSWLYRRCVICLLLFPATVGFFQLMYQSNFYLPECYLECKFSLKEKSPHKRNFYLE